MSESKFMNLEFRNAVYCGQASLLNGKEFVPDGPGIVLMDDNTCVLSTWQKSRIHPSKTVVILPNRTVLMFLIPNTLKLINPAKQTSILISATDPSLCFLDTGNKLYRLHVSLLQNKFQIVQQIDQTQKTEYLSKSMKLQDPHKHNDYFRYCLGQIQQVLGMNEPGGWFQVRQKKHQNVKEASRKEEKNFVIGTKKLHPSYEGFQISIFFSTFNERFSIPHIQFGSQKTYNYISTTILSNSQSYEVTEIVGNQKFIYRSSEKSNQQKDIQKLKKIHHIKSNNFVNRFFKQPLNADFSEILNILRIIDAYQRRKQQITAQNILETGMKLLPTQKIPIEQVKNQLKKAKYSGEYISKNSSPVFESRERLPKTKKFSKSFATTSEVSYKTNQKGFIPQSKRSYEYSVPAIYYEHLSEKKRRIQEDKNREKQIQHYLRTYQDNSPPKKSRFEKLSEKTLKIPNKDQPTLSERKEKSYLQVLTQRYHEIQTEIKKEFNHKHFPVSQFPYQTPKAKKQIKTSKYFCSKFS